jgi:hypothetical protein
MSLLKNLERITYLKFQSDVDTINYYARNSLRQIPISDGVQMRSVEQVKSLTMAVSHLTYNIDIFGKTMPHTFVVLNVISKPVSHVLCLFTKGKHVHNSKIAIWNKKIQKLFQGNGLMQIPNFVSVADGYKRRMDVIIWFVDVVRNGVGRVVLAIRRFIGLGILRMMRTVAIMRKILEWNELLFWSFLNEGFICRDIFMEYFLDIYGINLYFDYHNLLLSNSYCTKCIQCFSPF